MSSRNFTASLDLENSVYIPLQISLWIGMDPERLNIPISEAKYDCN